MGNGKKIKVPHTAANKERGEVELVLGKRTLVLAPDFERVQAMEMALARLPFGRTLSDLLDMIVIGRMPTLSEVMAVLDATVRKPRPGTEAIGRLLLKNGGVAAACPALITFGAVVLHGRPVSDLDEAWNRLCGGDAEGEEEGEEDGGEDDPGNPPEGGDED